MGVSPAFLFFGAQYGLTTRNDLLTQVWLIADRIARESGLEVFDVQLRREAIGWVLRLVIDREPKANGKSEDTRAEAVAVKDCQRVSTDVSAVLDAEFTFEHAYTLEVSSPGLDRPLRNISDCRRFTGRLARFVTSEAVEGQKFISGHIVGVEKLSENRLSTGIDHVMVDTGRGVYRIAWSNVKRARLEVEL